MTSLSLKTQQFLQDEQGVTTIEYALIAALISVALVSTFGDVTTALKTTYTKVITALNGG